MTKRRSERSPKIIYNPGDMVKVRILGELCSIAYEKIDQDGFPTYAIPLSDDKEIFLVLAVTFLMNDNIGEYYTYHAFCRSRNRIVYFLNYSIEKV